MSEPLTVEERVLLAHRRKEARQAALNTASMVGWFNRAYGDRVGLWFVATDKKPQDLSCNPNPKLSK